MLNFLPIDIVNEILLRLPAKSLSRMRCVCKALCDHIRDPNFVQKHLNHGVEHEKFRVLLFGFNQMYLSIGYFDSSSPSTCYYDVVEIDYPFNSSKPRYVHILASCYDLLCIQQNETDPICIWNPSTTEYKTIRRPPVFFDGRIVLERSLVPHVGDIVHCNFKEIAYGFVYGCSIKDCKLVRVASFGAYVGDLDERIYYGCEVMVCTLRSNSWKKILKKFPYNFGFNSGVLFNGALHWKAAQLTNNGNKDSDLIVSFSFEDERFIHVSPLPEHIDDNLIVTKLGNLGGCLCVFGERYPSYIEVWVMKHYGVRESWTKQFTFSGESLTQYSANVFRPIQCFKNGEIMLSMRSPGNIMQYALVLYDPEHESVRTLKISEADWFISPHTYVESLVSLNKGAYLSKKKVKNKKKNTRICYTTGLFNRSY